MGSAQSRQVDPEQPGWRSHPHRTRAGRKVADLGELALLIKEFVGLAQLAQRNLAPDLAVQGHQGGAAGRPHGAVGRHQRCPASEDSALELVAPRVNAQHLGVDRVAHPHRVGVDQHVPCLASGSFPSGQATQPARDPDGCHHPAAGRVDPPAPVTHTPLGPTPTAVGSPGSRTLTTTRLRAGSTRTSHPAGWRVLTPLQQHTPHTPPAVTAGDATGSAIASVATTRLLCGSTRSSRSPDSDTHSAPPPTAIPTTKQPPRTGGRPTVAATRPVWASTRAIAQPCAAQTTSPSAVTAVTSPSRTRAVTGDSVLEGDRGTVGELAVATGGGREERRLPPDWRPTTTRTPSTTTTTAMVRASVLLEGRILFPFREEHSGSFSQRARDCKGARPRRFRFRSRSADGLGQSRSLPAATNRHRRFANNVPVPLRSPMARAARAVPQGVGRRGRLRPRDPPRPSRCDPQAGPARQRLPAPLPASPRHRSTSPRVTPPQPMPTGSATTARGCAAYDPPLALQRPAADDVPVAVRRHRRLRPGPCPAGHALRGPGRDRPGPPLDPDPPLSGGRAPR